MGQFLSPAALPLPNFPELTPDSLAHSVKHQLAAASALVAEAESVVAGGELGYLETLEQAENQLQQAWGLLSHLNAVRNTPELRDTYNGLLPELSRFYTEQGQHQPLYRCYQRVAQSAAFAQLSPARQEAIRLALRDFELSGIALEGDAKTRYAAISERLSQLSSQFSDHLLDATQAFVHPLSAEECAGLPESSLGMLRQLGEARGFQQPVVTLDGPAYLAIMTYAEHRPLREMVYRAYVTRASEWGPTEQDNGPLMEEILALRLEMAQLLGFDSYAALSLATKMAPDVSAVTEFLESLANRARPFALKDLERLKQEATTLGLATVEPWDSAFLAERIKQREFSLSQESLKPYFPAPVVLSGLFAIVEKLYGIQIVECEAPVWHPLVQYFEIHENGHLLGGFYFDLYARSDKRGGAWMSGYRSRMETENGTQLPLAFMIGNFAPPVGDQPAQLSHDELVTLFHEFGHGLHHLLTEIAVLPVAGIHGVAWDAVELPSQFMEFWTWENEALGMISRHVHSGDTLPAEQLSALQAARHFQSGLQALRQLEFALFDLRIHALNPAPTLAGIQAELDSIRQQFALIQPPAYNRFQHSFSHIFAGGYAAGYYSYKWAEVLASDAFDRFEEEGIFNADTGRAFRREVLSRGASRPAEASFAAFRGRAPSQDALLRHSGWTSAHTDKPAMGAQV